MTIGVGFQCRDAVVLASDRQITAPGYHKFSERKIFSRKAFEYDLIYSYAGDQAAGQMMFRRLGDAFEEKFVKAPGTFVADRALKILEEVYFHDCATDLDTLVGVYAEHQPPSLFKTKGTRVVEGLCEYIGCGDSSALRYLGDFLTPQDGTVEEAVVLATYYVSVANRYIDGCSGGPDLIILGSDGTITEGMPSSSDQELTFKYFEKEIGKKLRERLLHGNNPTGVGF